MKKVLINELIGIPLDWAVAECRGFDISFSNEGGVVLVEIDGVKKPFQPSINPDVANEIIKYEGIEVFRFSPDVNSWKASRNRYYTTIPGKRNCRLSVNWAVTRELAAMRCYVTSVKGAEIAIPDRFC